MNPREVYTPQAFTAGRREGVTHLPIHVCPQRSLFSDSLSKKCHNCKKEIDTLPHLRPNKQVSPSTHTAKCEGGGDSPTLKMCLCGVCVRPLIPLPTLDIVWCVVVCICLCKAVCAIGGGGAYAFACVKCVGCYECMCHAPPNPL